MLDRDELRRSQDPYLRFAEILEATADFVATADLEGRTLFINRAGRRMIGLGEDEDVYGIPIGNKYADWARKVVLEQGIPAAVRDGVWNGETAFLAPDGREIPISQQIIAHRDEDGEVEYLSTVARDISGRKRAETERSEALEQMRETEGSLRASEARLRLALEAAELGDWELDLDTLEARRSPKHDQIFGYAEMLPEWTFEMFLEHVLPEDRAVVEKKFRDALENNTDWEFECRIRRADGEVRWIWARGRSHFDAAGTPTQVLGLVNDITERKASEEALRQTEQQYRSIFENTTDAVFVFDREGNIVEVNPAACAMHGYDREEFVGMHGMDIVHPEDHHKFADFVEQVSAGRKFEVEGVHVHRGGHSIDVEVTGTSFVFGGGPHLLAIVRDITERKQSEEELRESRDQLEVILGGISDGISAHSSDGSLVYMNDAHARILGYSSAREFLQEPFEERFREDFRRGAIMDAEGRPIGDPDQLPGTRALRGEEPPEQILRYLRPDGEERWLISRAIPIFDENGRVRLMITIVRDVTESRKAEAEIRNHARQQEAVADLGRCALAGVDLSALMEEAVECASKILEVEYCKVLELLPGGEELLLRAGLGWQEGRVGHATVGAHLASQAGYTLATDEPVVSEDLETETRFSGPPLLHGHGVVSGMSVIIRGNERPYGVFGVHTTQRRKFTEQDVNFLRSVANVLATAIERKRSEKALGEVREAERSRMARDLHDGALQDLAHAAVEMEILRTIPEDRDSDTRIERTIEILRRGGRGLRAAVYALRIEEEYNVPLHQLLGSLVERNRKMAFSQEIEMELQEGLPSSPLGEPGKELVQIVQEALTNARRHSGAGRVVVSARQEEGMLLVEISDDGQGFGPDVTPGMGSESMRERASAIGGKLTIESESGEGARVRLRVPLSSLQYSNS